MYIYESPDSGKTLYRRLVDSEVRELVSENNPPVTARQIVMLIIENNEKVAKELKGSTT
jgi:hypothetical protein|tara:strand:+ start:910 stop:1086 length:177 start_codon:yes stop_codon:yes gene_type:complete